MKNSCVNNMQVGFCFSLASPTLPPTPKHSNHHTSLPPTPQIHSFSTQHKKALNAYYDSAAMVAYAQASLVQLALIQQKVLLGSHDGSDEQYMATAGANAAWMQVCVFIFFCGFFPDAGSGVLCTVRVCTYIRTQSKQHGLLQALQLHPPPFPARLLTRQQARLNYNLDWCAGTRAVCFERRARACI
jgi:hypothetical protein